MMDNAWKNSDFPQYDERVRLKETKEGSFMKTWTRGVGQLYDLCSFNDPKNILPQ